jgi:hypothetical protein
LELEKKLSYLPPQELTCAETPLLTDFRLFINPGAHLPAPFLWAAGADIRGGRFAEHFGEVRFFLFG